MGAQYRLGGNWHLSAQLSYLLVKTSGTITTTNTMFTTDSPVLRAYQSYYVNDVISNTLLDTTQTNLLTATNSLLRQTAALRGGSLGTFVRRLDAELNPVVVSVSVGYSF